MPTYEYVCDACGEKFEKFQSMTAPAIKKCPKCGKNKVRRLIGTGAGLIFKGSGFYITDYRSDAYKNSEKSDKAGATTGDSKPAESGKGDAAAKTGDAAKPAETSKPAAEKSGGESSGGDKSGANKSSGEKSAATASSSPPKASRSAAKASSAPTKSRKK